jgi:hypothetical protein
MVDVEWDLRNMGVKNEEQELWAENNGHTSREGSQGQIDGP